MDAFLARMAARRLCPHVKAILFVDNAGADVVLGMIPLARELLKRGTQVAVSKQQRLPGGGGGWCLAAAGHAVLCPRPTSGQSPDRAAIYAGNKHKHRQSCSCCSLLTSLEPALSQNTDPNFTSISPLSPKPRAGGADRKRPAFHQRRHRP
jgi:hypothetical protein